MCKVKFNVMTIVTYQGQALILNLCTFTEVKHLNACIKEYFYTAVLLLLHLSTSSIFARSISYDIV